MAKKKIDWINILAIIGSILGLFAIIVMLLKIFGVV